MTTPAPPAGDTSALPLLGWREWAALPDLGLPRLKAKIDSGARTSALQAQQLQWLPGDRVRFAVTPLQAPSRRKHWCEAACIERRWVTDSGGGRELRPVIRTPLQLGEQRWDIELTLTAREGLRFRLLLGRAALGGRFLILPSASYRLGG